MKAKFINEAFKEDLDPVTDMGIGHPEIVDIQNSYKELEKYLSLQDPKDSNLIFNDVINLLVNLKKINYYTITMHLSKKYGMSWKINTNNPNSVAQCEFKGHTLDLHPSSSARTLHITFRGAKGYERTASCRSLKKLEQSFVKVCKNLNITL